MLVYGECECFVMHMLLMLVEDAIGDHTEAGLITAL